MSKDLEKQLREWRAKGGRTKYEKMSPDQREVEKERMKEGRILRARVARYFGKEAWNAMTKEQQRENFNTFKTMLSEGKAFIEGDEIVTR